MKILPFNNIFNFINILFPKEFPSWEKALEKSGGYNKPEILQKIKESALKIKNGEAVYERDSVIFNNIQYSWPILASLMWIAAQNNGYLNIIDFGGGLGTSYYQNKKFLSELKSITWNIIEQKHFVELGKKYFETENLKFYFDFDSCMQHNKINAILFSGVLQYLENPFYILEKARSTGTKFIIIDRTPIFNGEKDKIILQKIPKKIFEASYPSWIFSDKKLREFFKKDTIIECFDGLKEQLAYYASFKGYIIKLN